jgi:hypothetical protein
MIVRRPSCAPMAILEEEAVLPLQNGMSVLPESVLRCVISPNPAQGRRSWTTMRVSSRSAAMDVPLARGPDSSHKNICLRVHDD